MMDIARETFTDLRLFTPCSPLDNRTTPLRPPISVTMNPPKQTIQQQELNCSQQSESSVDPAKRYKNARSLLLRDETEDGHDHSN